MRPVAIGDAVRSWHQGGPLTRGAVATASYSPTFGLLGGRLRVGVGARFSAYHDEGRVEYPNGDAALLDAGARNVLSVPSPRTYALNLALQPSVRLVGQLELGADIDLAGVGFGPGATCSYAGADRALAGPQQARPTPWNLLLLGRHDRGQLDSEVFLAPWFGAVGVRAGVSHMSTEYTTARRLDGGNDRFRASATRFVLGTAWHF